VEAFLVCQLFEQLDNIARGFGGKHKPVAAGNQLNKDVLGVLPSSTSPLGWFPAISRAIGETFAPEVYKSAAKVSLAPNAERLGKAMIKERDGGQISNIISGVSAGRIAGDQIEPSNTAPGPYYEGNPEYSPLVNKMLNLLGLDTMAKSAPRATAESDYQRKRKQEVNRRQQGGK
jgi:hypothetical protein